MVAEARAQSAWKVRVAGVSPDAYIDFPVVADGSLSVVVSNDVAVSPVLKLKVPRRDESADPLMLGMRRYRGKCSLYLGGECAASFDDTFDGTVSLLVPEGAIPAEAGEVYVQNLASFTFADAFMVAEGDKTGLQNWEVLAGDWSLHAVTGRTVRAGDKNKLARYPTQERSPNFYCLNAFGNNAAIVAGELFYSHYSIQASLQQTDGTNGIAFLVSDEGKGYTFTAQQDQERGRLDFVLRSGFVAGETAGTMLAAVKTELTPGQWYMLEVRLTDDEIICYVDGIAVIRRKEKLPAGGLFGLFTDTLEAHPARFDDVVVETWTGFDSSLFEEEERAASAAFGCPLDPPAAITLPAKLSAGQSVELFVGRTSVTSAPAYSLVCEKTGAGECRVALYSAGGAVTNDLWTGGSFPREGEDGESEFTLDATGDGVVVGKVNNVTVVMAYAPAPASGIAGYTTVIPHRRLGKVLGLPSVTREKSPYTDRFEKNKIFVADPFMRHWASTEGQWLTYTNGTAWYKDDVLNRATLTFPAVNGTDLRFAVPEDDPEAYGIRVTCQDNKLSIFSHDGTNRYTWAYSPANMVGDTDAMTATNNITLRYDGTKFMFASETGAVYICSIPYPQTGRRMYFKRHPQHYLGKIIVLREPVLDCLFSESLHDWTINGGTWEIINRFQCYPDWSHMDGENPQSVAALWSKYEIEGDFCAMFVCGMRHGWYERVGDFNLTIFNKETTPSEGYTLKVTGWDPDSSQRWSTLYRNGEPLARTDVKAAPRRREGNVRTGYEPLVAKGRDVHGAWYSIKFRKLGDKLDALFDNLPLLSATDPQPLSSGGIGIWTFRSSMVVARVRVTAENIRPRKFAFTAVKSEAELARTRESDEAPAGNLSFNGFPVDLVRPGIWHGADDVSFPEVSIAEEDGENVLLVSSLHGSGSFLAAPELPSVTADKIAGWTFEVARSPRAKFNFEYSLSEDKSRTLFSRYICGSTERKGPRLLTDCSAVEPEPTPYGAKKKIWTPVTVWLPPTGQNPANLTVSVEGFGNLQPSEVQQGLAGNGPGEWYAVRKFYPVYRNAPSPDNASENEAAFASDIRKALEKGTAGQLNAYRVSSSACKTRPVIQWTLPPADNQGLIANFVDAPDSVIRITSTLPWPSPLLCATNVTVNGLAVPYAFISDGALTVPYTRPMGGKPSSPVKVSFTTTEGRPFTQILPATVFARAEGASERAPVITGINFPPDFPAAYQNFESRTQNIDAYKSSADVVREARVGDEQQSTYLHLSNNGRQSRLAAVLVNQYSVYGSPLVQFRYRGDEMALVNFTPRTGATFHFSDSVAGNRRSVMNNTWQTALCRMTKTDFDMKPGAAFTQQAIPLAFSSYDIVGFSGDQTGLYSYLDIDDIAVGPAVGPANAANFRFRPTIDAPDGLGVVEYAVSNGETPYLSLPEEAAAQLKWQAIDMAAAEMTAPSLAGIADGVHHLLIRAKAPGGATSAVADIPFVYDSVPPTIASSVITGTNNPALFNGSVIFMRVSGDVNGAAPQLLGAKFTANGVDMGIRDNSSGTFVVREDNRIEYTMNWPLAARSVIQTLTNGATLNIVAENISDGAGNVAPPLSTQFTIDYASDHTPPSFVVPQTQRHLGGSTAPLTTTSFFDHFFDGLEAKMVPGNGMDVLSIRVKDKDVKKKETWRHYGAVANINTKKGRWHAPTDRWLMMRVRIPEDSPRPVDEALELHFSTTGTPDDAKFKTDNNVYNMKIPAVNVTNEVGRPVGLYGNTDFAPGKWVDLAVDVNAFLRHAAGTKGNFSLYALQFQMPAISNYRLEVETIFVTRDIPDTKKNINFNAYDISGIDGLYSDGEKLTGWWSVTPNRLYEIAGDKMFAKLKLRDKAGNETPVPIIVPLPPRVPKP